MRLFFLLLVSLLSSAHLLLSGIAESDNPIRKYTGQTVFDLEYVPEENVDIGLWSLIISKTYNSTVDVLHYLEALKDMKYEIDRMIAGRNTDMAKFIMTKMFQFDSGVWNGNKPFMYDLDDPPGENPKNRLLTKYIDTRKGNCVCMPTLFLEYADLMLRLNLKSITGLVYKGSLLAWKGQYLLEIINAQGRQPDSGEHKKLQYYRTESDRLINRAQALGWRQESQEYIKKYLHVIEEQKGRSNK